MEESIELYTCKESAYDSEIPADNQNSTVPRSYNELATLMSVTGAHLCCHLMLTAAEGHAILHGSQGTAWLEFEHATGQCCKSCFVHLVASTMSLCRASFARQSLDGRQGQGWTRHCSCYI